MSVAINVNSYNRMLMIKESGRSMVGNFLRDPDNAELNEGDVINFQTGPLATSGEDPIASYVGSISNDSTMTDMCLIEDYKRKLI